MSAVFENHTVVCGWNDKAKSIVETLQLLTAAPILVVHPDASAPIAEVGDHRNVFITAGDPSDREVLINADIASAKSVIVLANGTVGKYVDAHSVKVALAVEKIQVSVHTVVELRDLRNKDHFHWTKVDEVISDEELSVKMMSQGIRHILSRLHGDDSSSGVRETLLLETYEHLICPHKGSSQLFRVDTDWDDVKQLTFCEIVSRGVGLGLLPLAVAGYVEHEIPSRPDQDAWISWKINVIPNPKANKPLGEFWPKWPGPEFRFGIIVLAPSRSCADALAKSFA